jgi:ABC-2 type transport system permease protein
LFNLILNENMKIYRRWRTWVMVGLLLVFVSLTFVIQASVSDGASTSDWREVTAQRLEMNEKMLAEPMLDKQSRIQLQKEVDIDRYRLANNVAPQEETLWGDVLGFSSFVSLIIIFVVIVAADSVAGEFSAGTIKLLLLQPASRSTILLAKYISVFLFALFLVLILMAAAAVGGAILHGFADTGVTHLTLSASGEVVAGNLFIHTLKTYGLQCVMLVFVATIAFLISTVFRSSAMAISIAVGLQLFGPLVTMFLLGFDWAKYILFVHIDLTQYLNHTPLIAGTTMTFAVTVLIVYFVVLNAITWLLFNRRDVA